MKSDWLKLILENQEIKEIRIEKFLVPIGETSIEEEFFEEVLKFIYGFKI